MTIRCIVFDLDDTLWDCHSVIQQAEQEVYSWLSAHYPRISERYTLSALIQHRINFMKQHPELHYNLGALRKKWLAQLADEAGYSRALVEPCFMVFWLARNRVTFYKDVVATLTRLTQRYSLGVISNGNADVHHIGIGELFAFVHSSAAAGVGKPAPAIFQQAIAMAQLPAHEMVYVGDDLEKDIGGAQYVGMRTVWLQHSTSTPILGIQPDITIQHFSELESALRTL